MIIHASSIHSGGGKVLLDKLIADQEFGAINFLICDQRYELPKEAIKISQIIKIKPSLISRWRAEFLLKNICNQHPELQVLCFSNLPPAFRLKNKVILYLQNALLLPNIPIYTDSLKVRLRLSYEKVWLNLFWKNIDEVWVQTDWMKNALLDCGKTILIKPFLPLLPDETTKLTKKYDYITISGTASHKRLLPLLKAWDLFTDEPIPSLLVVTDGSNHVFDEYFHRLKNKNVTVKLNATREAIFNFYRESENLIVTSRVESFCLPIYEAFHFNLKILAPDEEYAKDSNKIDAYIDLSSPQETYLSIRKFIQHNK